jgi:hypothetical protein
MYDTGATCTQFDEDVLLCEGDGHLVLSNEMVLVEDLDSVLFSRCPVRIYCARITNAILPKVARVGGVGYKRWTHSRVRTLSKGVSKGKFLGSESAICTPSPTCLS